MSKNGSVQKAVKFAHVRCDFSIFPADGDGILILVAHHDSLEDGLPADPGVMPQCLYFHIKSSKGRFRLPCSNHISKKEG